MRWRPGQARHPDNLRLVLEKRRFAVVRIRGSARGEAMTDRRSRWVSSSGDFRRVRRVRLAAIAVALTSLASCASPTTPDRPAEDTPEIQFSDFQPERLIPGGFLFIEARPQDWAYRLPSNRFLVVSVTTSAGESEVMRLKRAICGLESGQSYLCRFFSISVATGSDVRALTASLASRNARFSLIAQPPTYASAYAFDDWKKTMAFARSLPGVLTVDFVNVSSSGSPGQIPFAALLAGALPFERGSPVANDGVVTALPSDSVWVRYTQPSGALVTLAFMPPG